MQLSCAKLSATFHLAHKIAQIWARPSVESVLAGADALAGIVRLANFQSHLFASAGPGESVLDHVAELCVFPRVAGRSVATGPKVGCQIQGLWLYISFWPHFADLPFGPSTCVVHLVIREMPTPCHASDTRLVLNSSPTKMNPEK
jgi:hypothetical protein